MEDMDNVEVLEVVKVTEEVEDVYSQVEMTSPKKKRGKADENSHERPKKPRSAYLLYYFDVHQVMQLGTPNLPQSEVNKRISESWRRLSVAEKSYYLERAKLEKDGIDTTSQSSSKHLPGFRKILPRANCFLVPNSASPNYQAVGSQSEVCIESIDFSAEGSLCSVALRVPKSKVAPVELAAEVEISEPPTVPSDTAEETVVSSPQRTSPWSSSKTLTSTDVQGSQGSVDEMLNDVSLNTKAGGVAVQMMQREATQMVTIVPSQSQLEPQPLAGISSLQPVMMISVGAKSDQIPKPSYKMSVKTYTRRGRGRCLNPGCSFVYVTRHKPPTCPECGSHLGGKWIPAVKAKRTQDKAGASKLTTDNKSDESRQAALHVSADTSKTSGGGNKEGQANRSNRKQPALSAAAPPEGSSNTSLSSKQIKVNTKSTHQKPARSCAVVQKRPVRPILPAVCNPGNAVIQILTVAPEKEKPQGVSTSSHSAAATVPQEILSSLKPSTLKQLGQTAPTTTTTQVKTHTSTLKTQSDSDEVKFLHSLRPPLQDSSISADRSKHATSTPDTGVNVLSLVPFRHTVSCFDLGLSTARGRGRCKNPACDYMYKNRHKPAVCPKCGSELTRKNTKPPKSETLLDPHQDLSPAQRDVQRQSTLQLIRSTLQIPESDTELQETMSLIQELNSVKIVLVKNGEGSDAETETLLETGWPQFYESAATHCGLCSYRLLKGERGTVAGQEDCWLLTETLMQTASLQLKVCPNLRCLALHSFADLHPGLFNVGNRLLVSLDLFLKIRANIKLGQTPPLAAQSVFDQIQNHPIHSLTAEESSHVQELFLSGYWAFECLTMRDYNDMICGICGVAPKVEIAQRHRNDVLELKNVEFTWPECSVSDEVHVDDFWLTMEGEAIEQAAFPADIPITRVDASIIAPFAPPLMRSPTVINTEKDKLMPPIQQPAGDPSVLVRLIHDGQLRLDRVEDHSEDELRAILDSCGVDLTPGSTKNELLASLVNLYTHVHSGLPTAPQPPAHLTAGKLSKMCPHKVVCSSKYLVRGETARDHVDLLLSSRYWPPVYVCDCPRQVALCTDLQYPELATQMWGRNQGCFSDPFEKPEFVTCPELQDQPYAADLSLVAENQLVHPITKSPSCWLAYPPGAARDAPAQEHHRMIRCRDLEPYINLLTELDLKKEEHHKEENMKEQTDIPENDSLKEPEDDVNTKPMIFNNTAYYYLYNRLVDFLSSRDIVNQQISQVVKACQPGEVVIRDSLYRLGVAQINTDGDEGARLDAQTEEEGEKQLMVLSN
ncbi:HMG domain-containing protein 3 isoform X1 [Poecilia latipinna]|uniref:HMG domain-containing protein 3 isoform X1 n=1 Tax=Poecilia latipinna TaxID=48699 RepID=UPI00072EC2F1|nr:PREDICTED: HMG domain-containing protein 3-like isoform X1 [Poecilia latipinna]XP_014876410.1 PREDICTED: HMG domain-containing protein 3-like isoform X1 [Poecilia latipinna]XP_014876411.1 PREDICTED: HMG domain-containing protein 3-like isoform X1 [Poecilia latipinna]XP_014876412.1 PREDICTED: HMG domain-containing protein 3-like isoform X1 [Poecilia latipinna]